MYIALRTLFMVYQMWLFIRFLILYCITLLLLWNGISLLMLWDVCMCA